MIVWIRPTGSEITTNEEKATIEHCKKLGWKLATEKQESKKHGNSSKRNTRRA